MRVGARNLSCLAGCDEQMKNLAPDTLGYTGQCWFYFAKQLKKITASAQQNHIQDLNISTFQKHLLYMKTQQTTISTLRTFWKNTIRIFPHFNFLHFNLFYLHCSTISKHFRCTLHYHGSHKSNPNHSVGIYIVFVSNIF